MKSSVSRRKAWTAAFPLLLVLSLLCASCSRQARAARHLALAEKAFSSGQFDKAEIEYRNVLLIEISDPTAISRLGIVYFEEGRTDRAVPFLRKGMTLQPDNTEVMLDLARIYLSAGNLRAAREGAISVLNKNPADPDAPAILAETAVFPIEYEEISRRLRDLRPPAPQSAPVILALGILQMRSHNLREAETYFRKALETSPDSRAAHLDLGTLLWSRKDYSGAELNLASASATAPLRSRERMQYAEFKFQTEGPKAARQFLNDLTTQAPDYIPAWLLLAKISSSTKNFEEARSSISKVLARDPGNPEALLLGAQLKIATGDSRGAIVDLEKLQKLYPKSANVCYQLAQGYIALGDQSRAVQSLNQALVLAPGYTPASILLAETNIRRRDFLAAFLGMQQLTHDRPEFLQGWLLLADADRGLGHLDDALLVYRQVDRAFPNSAETALLTGAVFLQMDKLAEARESFNRALEIAPNYLGAADQLINLDLLEEKFDQAAKMAKDAVQKHPHEAAPLILLAKAHLALKQIDGAEQELAEALKIEPESGPAVYLLARIYIATNRQQAALNDLQKVLLKNPKAVSAMMLIASIDEQEGKYAGARDAYEGILEVDPRAGTPLNNLAYIYSEKLGLLDKAYTLAQRATESEPEEAHFADTLGWIQFKRHQFASALHFLQQSATELPRDAEVQFHFGMAQYVTGEEVLAITALKRVLELDPNFHEADQVRHRIAVLNVVVESQGPGGGPAAIALLSSDPTDPVAMVRLGDIFRHQSEASKAIASYQSALTANSDYKPALVGLISIYSSNHDFGKALEIAKRARTIYPNDVGIARSLGWLAFETADYKWAASLLREAAATLPDDGSLQEQLGLAAYSVGRIGDAVDSIHRALELGISGPNAAKDNLMLEMIALADSPRNAVRSQDRLRSILATDRSYVPALMALGRCEEAQNDQKGGLTVYLEVLQQYPDFTPAMKRIAIIDAQYPTDDKKALELAGKARQVYPDDPELSRAYGIIIYRTGDFARAAEVLRETVSRNADDADLMYYLGMSEFRLNQRPQSREDLSRALRLNLRSDFASDAKRALGSLN